MNYQNLSRIEKSVIMYLIYFQLIESSYDYELDEKNYITLIEKELTRLDMPPASQVVYDNDGEPMINWQAEQPNFVYWQFISTIPELEEGAPNPEAIGGLPFTFKYSE